MDDFTQKLQGLLSDPESMRNLSELAAMLRAPEGMQEPVQEPPSFDMGKLMAIGQAMGRMQQDTGIRLLEALRGNLSQPRRQRAEQAIRLLQLWQMVQVLQESGMLAEFGLGRETTPMDANGREAMPK